MEKWEKIEDLLNGLLIKLGELLVSILKKVTPKKVQSRIDQFESAVLKKKIKLLQKTDQVKADALTKVLKAKEEATSKINASKEAVATTVVKVKGTKISDIKPKKILAAIIAFLMPPIAYIKKIFASIKPPILLAGVATLTFTSLIGLNIYKNTKQIVEEVSEPEVVEEVEGVPPNPRAPYYRLQDKRFMINGITLPVYIEKNSRSARTLTLDLTVISSNKYIKEYFFENMHVVRDYLNTHLEPVVLEFPMEEEGKRILKTKIKEELNSLLKKYKIKGEIDQILIHAILTG